MSLNAILLSTGFLGMWHCQSTAFLSVSQRTLPNGLNPSASQKICSGVATSAWGFAKMSRTRCSGFWTSPSSMGCTAHHLASLHNQWICSRPPQPSECSPPLRAFQSGLSTRGCYDFLLPGHAHPAFFPAAAAQSPALLYLAWVCVCRL